MNYEEKERLVKRVIEINERKDLFEQYIDEKYIDINFDGDNVYLSIVGIKLDKYECDFIFNRLEEEFYDNEEPIEIEEDDPLDRLKNGIIVDQIGDDND